MSKKQWIWFVATFLVGLGVGFLVGTDQAIKGINRQIQEQQAGIANPASTNCITLGGTLEIKDEVNGQAGYCHMKDGRVCEEWALFRDGSCKGPQ